MPQPTEASQWQQLTSEFHGVEQRMRKGALLPDDLPYGSVYGASILTPLMMPTLRLPIWLAHAIKPVTRVQQRKRHPDENNNERVSRHTRVEVEENG